MSRDPFRGRHATRRHTGRRILITGAAAGAVLAGAVVIASHAGAATRPGLGASVARAATIAADRFTPSPAPITPAHGSQAAHGPLGPSGLHWERVPRATAHQLGISPRSVMIIGPQQTVIVTPRGTVAGRS